MSVPEVISEEEKEAAYKWISYFTSPEVNGEWAQNIGYIPVRNSVLEVPEYAQFVEDNPYNAIPYEQAQTASVDFVDPTGGKIIDAIAIATDKVELQNIPEVEHLQEQKEFIKKNFIKL